MDKRKVIYQVFIRNHTEEGTFKALENDLDRIKELGVDILYLMPINEIGKLKRKGTYGSPYASKDYFSISKDLGTLADLKSLINKTHQLGMKIILDMVFNHTSPDNVLVKKHPEYYFKRDGEFANKVGDWSDIIDLETKSKEVQLYLLSVLKYWLGFGFDGFRFDIASLIPLSFFELARKQLGDDIIFLAETCESKFINYAKRYLGFDAHHDDELVPIFDLLYNYNNYCDLQRYYEHNKSLELYVHHLNTDHLPRISCMENHDTQRLMSLCHHDKEKFISLVKLMFEINANPFIYAGMEYGNSHRPELFEKDPINHSENDFEIYQLFKDLIKQKKEEKEIINQQFFLTKDGEIKVMTIYADNEIKESIYRI